MQTHAHIECMTARLVSEQDTGNWHGGQDTPKLADPMADQVVRLLFMADLSYRRQDSQGTDLDRYCCCQVAAKPCEGQALRSYREVVAHKSKPQEQTETGKKRIHNHRGTLSKRKEHKDPCSTWIRPVTGGAADNYSN